MYSQYYYQDHGGATTTQTTTATSVQPTNLTWNGSQWVSISSSISPLQPSTSSTHRHHLHHGHNHSDVAVAKIPPPKTKLPPTPVHLKQGDESLMTLDQLVQHYSTIYHFYAKEVSSFNNNGKNTTEGNKKKEWAVYHCDLSARAAHHYNDLLTKRQTGESFSGTKVGGMMQTKCAEQQKELSRGQHQEPAPSCLDKCTTVTTPATIKTITEPNVTPSEQPPPESFRRYAHKNLLLCNTETQRRAMQELLTLTMSTAIQKQEFYGTDWDYEPSLPIPGGGDPTKLLQKKIAVQDNKNISHQSQQPEGMENGPEVRTAIFPLKVSSNFQSSKRKHSSSERGDINYVKDYDENEDRVELSESCVVNNWSGDGISKISNESNHNDSGVIADNRDGTCSKTLKNISNSNEQKTTLDDWYGGSGGDMSTNDVSQSGACITFEPKVFKKKKKRNYRTMNSRSQKGTSLTSPEDSKIQKNYRTVANNIVMNENESQNNVTASPKKLFHLSPHVTVSEWYDRKAFINDNENSMSLTPASKSIQEQQLKTGVNVIAHRPTNSKSQEQQRETVFEWYDNSSAQTSSSPSTITSPLKKEIDKRHQMQTLDDWYGCDKSADSKNNTEAVIMFKPKPLKKKKKNRKYMNRSSTTIKPKTPSTQEKCAESRMPSTVMDDSPLALSGNGITMLPRVQSGPTTAAASHYEKSHGNVNVAVNSNKYYNFDKHSNPNDSNSCMLNKVQSIQQEEEHFIPLNCMPSETTNQQPWHHETMMMKKDSNYSETGDMECSSPLSNPLLCNGIINSGNISATKSQRNNYIRQTNDHANILGNDDSPKKISYDSFTAYQLTQSKNNYTKITHLSTHSPLISNNRKCLTNSNSSKYQSSGFERSKTKLASRANRFAEHDGTLHMDYSQNADRYMGKSLIGGTLYKTLTEEDYENMTVKGFCQVLEKPYLRLTSPPRAEFVRPQRILRLHLANLKKKWLLYRTNLYSTGKTQGCSGDELSYTWFCSQLKAIRQDLTVQRIFNAFAVDVYETHAKIALQENDLNEYNQSQTQLKELYNLLSRGGVGEQATHLKIVGLEHENEFIAYRIIYYIFLTCNKKYDGGSSDLLKIMISLTPSQRKDPAIVHALKVRVAVAEHDYHAFFQLQDVCPNLGAYLMDTLVPQVRALGLKHMIKAYRPSISIMFILQELGFSVDEADVEGGRAWLSSCGCNFSNDRCMIMTKKTDLNEAHLAGVRNSSLI